MDKIKSCFSDIIGYDSVKSELYKIAHTLRDIDTYKNKGIKTPNGLLLSGVPGVGKTSMANCLIKASGRKVYVCRKDKANGTFTKHIKSTFTRAINNQPCIVLLDDLDKFANDDYDHRDSEEYVVVQSCIDNIKGKDVFVIATVNDEEKLPYSLCRAGRFDTKIFVENPTAKDAEDIVKHYMSNKKVGDLDYKTISRLLNGASCAQLETVVNEAGILSTFKGKDSINMDDITRACLRVIYDAPESSIVTDHDKRLYIAVHEVGHAIVSDALIPESVNFISVRQHNSNIGGFTDVFDEDEDNREYTTDNELINICIDVAGVLAVKMYLGKDDCGGSSDYRNAFKTCCHIVQGCMAYGVEYGNNINSFGTGQLPTDDKSRRKIRNKIIKIISKQQKLANKILKNNKEFVHKLVDYLMKDDTMTRDAFLEIKKEVNKNYYE